MNRINGMTMNRITRLKAALVGFGLAFAGFAATAEAASVLIDKSSYTYDPTSGLDWLDLTASTNLQPSEILTGAGSFIASGWHYAKVDELKGLFADAGIPALSDYAPNSANYTTYGSAPDSSILGLINLLGDTGGSGGSYLNFAMGILEGNTDGQLYFSQLGIYDTSTAQGNVGSSASIYILTFLFNTYPLDTTAGVKSTVAGNFLIRDHSVAATPLPAALPMFAAATGLMGLMGWRRRNMAQA